MELKTAEHIISQHRAAAKGFEEAAQYEVNRLRQEAKEMMIRADGIEEAIGIFHGKRKLRDL